MIAILIRIYRANPVRPHCRAGHHVALCRLIIPLISGPELKPGDYCGSLPGHFSDN